MSMDVILQQVLIIFGYVLVGWVACKMGVLNGTINKEISNIIIKITLPLSILATADVDTAGNDLLNMGFAAFILLVSYIVTACGVMWYAKVKKLTPALRAAYSGLCVFPNSGFIGIPLCVALMGERGMLYGAAGLVAYNSLFFTYQCILFRPNEKISFKAFATVLNGSLLVLIVMIVLGLRWPTPVQVVSYNVGAMTTPLALMIVGTMLAEGDLRSVFCSKVSYVITLLRNFIIPFALLFVLALLPLDYEMKLATMIYAACPCANLTAVFATQTNMEPELCGKTILLSTVFFMLSLPIILWAAQIMFA